MTRRLAALALAPLALLGAAGLALRAPAGAQGFHLQRPPPPTGRCEVTDDATVARLTHDVTRLASDELGGREPGTDGIEQAAQFLIARLTELGVEPAGTDGFRQPFRVEYGVESDPSSAVVIRANGATRTLALNRDFRVAEAPPFSGDGRAVGALVYVGHALESRDAHWNDFAHGVPLRGRIAVALSGRPQPVDPALTANLDHAHVVGSLAGKVRAAREHGAAGLIEVELDPREPAETYAPAPASGIPVVRVTRAQGAWLLGLDEGTLAPERAEVAPRRLVGASARVLTATHHRWVTTSNVVGVVRGRTRSDAGVTPTQGVFVVGAHYDHIGRGAMSSLAPGVYAIHNGADDNASGTAAVLEVARRVARAPLSRDVVFTWFASEELGLVGSRWMVAHRPPALRDVAVMMNMDMVGRLRECRLFVESRDTARLLPAAIEEANRGYHFDARAWEVTRPSWGASDHMSFVEARVPAVFLFTGLHDDYHRPSDDAPTLNYRGLGAVAGFAEGLLRRLAESAERDPAGLRFVP